jgi:mannosyltransferase OCH1-like enzyme
MPIAHQRWVESCQYAHTAAAGWQLRFWDWGASEALIAEHYPWFLPFYQNNVSRAIEKSDLVRYAIMHHIGGGWAGG